MKQKPIFPIVQVKQMVNLQEVMFKTILRVERNRDVYEIHQTDLMQNKDPKGDYSDLDLGEVSEQLQSRYKYLINHWQPNEFTPPAEDLALELTQIKDLHQLQFDFLTD